MKQNIIQVIKGILIYMVLCFIITLMCDMVFGLLQVACADCKEAFYPNIINFISKMVIRIICVYISLKCICKTKIFAENKLILPCYLIISILTHPGLYDLSVFRIGYYKSLVNIDAINNMITIILISITIFHYFIIALVIKNQQKIKKLKGKNW